MNNKPSSLKTRSNGPRALIARLFSPLLMFCGLVGLCGVTLAHILRHGAALSHEEKIIYLISALIGGILILVSLFAQTSSGKKVLAHLLNLQELETAWTQHDSPSRLLGIFNIIAAFSAIFLFFIDTKLAAYNLDAARYFNDTPGYLRTASYLFSEKEFWSGERPFTLPLFYKLIGYDLLNFSDQAAMEQTARIQLVLSTLSWMFLGLSASLLFKRWAFKFTIAGIIVLVGSSVYITSWDRLMLSDSLSLSLFALLLALIIFSTALWCGKKQRGRWQQISLVISMVLVATVYGFSRDSNPYFLFLLGGLMALGLVLRLIRTHRWIIGYICILLSFITISGIQIAGSNKNARYVTPVLFTYVYRFFPDEEMLAFALDHGLPYDQQRFSNYDQLTLRQLGEQLLVDDPEGRLLAWIEEHGKGTLARYMLTHPGYTFIQPLNDVQILINGDLDWYRKIISPAPLRLKLLSNVVYPKFPASVIIFLVFFGISIFLSIKYREGKMVIPLFLFITSIPLIWMVWHADYNDLARHALQPALQLRLASWLCFLLLMEKVNDLFLGSRYRMMRSTQNTFASPGRDDQPP